MQPCLGPDLVLVLVALILQMAAIGFWGDSLPTAAGQRNLC